VGAPEVGANRKWVQTGSVQTCLNLSKLVQTGSGSKPEVGANRKLIQTGSGFKPEVDPNRKLIQTGSGCPIKYSCEDCNFSCYRKDGLTQHIKQVHLKLKRHHCTVCPEAYMRRSDFEKHKAITGH